MQRQADTHLTLDEIDAFLHRDSSEEAREHLQGCRACRSLLEAHEEEDARLASLKSSGSDAAGPECPTESEWLKVASGMKRGSEAQALVHHSASCDHCGPLLRQALEDFADDVSGDEEALLAGLPSSGHEWQKRVPAGLTRSGSTWSISGWLRQHLRVAPRLPLWAWSAGAAVLCVGAAWFYVQQQPSVDQLLASAYTEQRTLDLRIPDAAYAPVRLVRGSAESRLDRPAALLASEARIARELEKDPGNPRWVAARGRAELLERDYDSAIASFQKALASQPDSNVLMTDLASAFFERAEANRSAADYNRGVEVLSRVLQKAPDDPVALFNRAIVYERLGSYDQAIADWEHYLRIDLASSWVHEAAQRLARARNRH